jgi:hypothetical protein
MSPLDRIDWLASVAGDKALPPSALAVAVVVAKFTNAKTGDARPSKETIARMAGTDERAVRRMVRALEERGWMNAAHTKGRMCCNYRPTNPGTTTRVEPGHSNPGKNNPGTTTRVPVVPQPGQGDAANPGTVTPQTRIEQVSEQENIPESVFLDADDGCPGPGPDDEPPSDLEQVVPEWVGQGQPETPAPAKKPKPPANPSTPSEFDFILDNGQTWNAPQDLVDSIKKTYPKINIKEQFGKAALWLQTNPERRKTARGMPRFLSSWADRASSRPQGQNNGNSSSGWGNMPLDSNGYPDVDRMFRENIKIPGMEADWK